ncbi:ABC transporter substrate-binding protein [Sanguibacter sp. HDW7]|uniref:ABC transporter substrate-binding protein n=1 Tax=Sanguibacter sp. HDW7 TaxID=2714931 RepID=UPI00140AEB64|nr:ABC transporter substrate-binding protein [Sanguibacter sp. HDW7]QIK84731.1 ABC transporter substrate-binding protein [Sanguibacter sp. HDW7]
MLRTGSRKRLIPLVALVSSVALFATACSGDGKTEETSKPGAGGSSAPSDKPAEKVDRPLVVFAGSQTPITANFNPYAPTVLHGALGPIYETLFHYNKTSADPATPMLGESFEFNAEGTEATIKLRAGVKWNDGKDFTADDVVFSFTNVAKANYIDSAEAVDATTVKLKFNAPSFTNEWAIFGATFIVPKHVFGEFTELEKLVAFANDKAPVGTGPFVLEAATSASYTLKANPNYWQTGKPALQEVQYLGIDGNSSAQAMMQAGEIDYMSLFVPNPESLTGTGDIAMVNTPMDPTVLYTCANADLGCKGAQTDVAVRNALSLALDRKTINDKAFVGLAGTISPTFALLGRDDKWIADGMPKEIGQTADVAGAEKILTDAGYAKGSDGIFAKDGQKVSMKLKVISDWSDYVSAVELISSQAKAAGIEVKVETTDWDGFSNARLSGDYELIIGGMVGTSLSDPFQLYRDWFAGTHTQKVGTNLEPGEWNMTRYSNKIVDDAIATAAGTRDEAAKKEAYGKIQTEIVRDLPYIPLIINATQTWFNTVDYGNWPTESNMFAFPAAWGSVSSGVVLSSITGPSK